MSLSHASRLSFERTPRGKGFVYTHVLSRWDGSTRRTKRVRGIKKKTERNAAREEDSVRTSFSSAFVRQVSVSKAAISLPTYESANIPPLRHHTVYMPPRYTYRSTRSRCLTLSAVPVPSAGVCITLVFFRVTERWCMYIRFSE